MGDRKKQHSYDGLACPPLDEEFIRSWDMYLVSTTCPIDIMEDLCDFFDWGETLGEAEAETEAETEAKPSPSSRGGEEKTKVLRDGVKPKAKNGERSGGNSKPGIPDGVEEKRRERNCETKSKTDSKGVAGRTAVRVDSKPDRAKRKMLEDPAREVAQSRKRRRPLPVAGTTNPSANSPKCKSRPGTVRGRILKKLKMR